MHGPAGTGKTALAQTIGELCKENGLLAASFFFSRTALGRNNGQTLLPTLAYQLTISYPEARYVIRKRIENDPSLLDQSIQTIMEELLVASFSSWFCIIPCWITGSFLFQTAFSWVRPRLVVIDGLDECEDPRTQCDILRAIATATKQLRLPFRFLVTSRPEPHIMQEFDGEPIFKFIDLIMLNLADRNAEDDIRIYLTEEFKRIRTVHPLGPHSPCSWPDHEAISEITRKASGQFVYAAVVINYLQSRKHSPKDRLDTILGISEKPNHDSPFAQLDELYAHILSSVQEDNLDDLRLILGILASEVQSHQKDDGLWTYNSPDVIEKLLSLDTGRVDHLLDDLRSLIGFNARDQPMKFFHASFSDFLLDPKRSGKFHVAADYITEALAKGYLRLLQIQAEHHLRHSRRPGPIEKPPPEHARLISLLFTSIDQWKKMVLSRALVDDLQSFDFSVIIKSLFHIFPRDLQSLKVIWTSRVLQDLLHFLVRPIIFLSIAWAGLASDSLFFFLKEDTGINLEPLIKNIDRDFPLGESIFLSLQEFLERPRFKEYVGFVFLSSFVRTD